MDLLTWDNFELLSHYLSKSGINCFSDEWFDPRAYKFRLLFVIQIFTVLLKQNFIDWLSILNMKYLSLLLYLRQTYDDYKEHKQIDFRKIWRKMYTELFLICQTFLRANLQYISKMRKWQSLFNHTHLDIEANFYKGWSHMC